MAARYKPKICEALLVVKAITITAIQIKRIVPKIDAYLISLLYHKYFTEATITLLRSRKY